MAQSRFATLSSEDIDLIELQKDSKNTQKVINKSVNVLRLFLTEKGADANFENSEIAQLDETLRDFYANARTEKGERYKVNSYVQIRYGISKFLKKKDIDINTPAFARSNETFKAVKVDLARKGKGGVLHKPCISKEDLTKLYEDKHVFSTDTPVGLQQKVFFEIVLYTCRRGRENLHGMTKDSFVVAKDGQGREFVEKKYAEVDKNHREGTGMDDTNGDGRMYDRPGSPFCPVASYKKYLSNLHPQLIPNLNICIFFK